MLAFFCLISFAAAAVIPDDALPPPVIPEPRQSTSCSTGYTFSREGPSSVALQSVGYPNNYPAGLNCTYTINSYPNSQIRMDCSDFNVEYQSSCSFDVFKVSVTGHPQLTDSQQACGKGTFSKTSNANSLTMSFKSDSANPGSGGPFRFQCLLTAVPTPVLPALPTLPLIPANSTAASGSSTSPAKCNCGVKNEAARIVGGVQSLASEFPWRVALYSPSMGVFCGGTVISPNWVMTAAHCTNAVPAGAELFIDASDHDLSSALDGKNLLVKVDRISQHESYDSKTQNNDISLLHLSTSLTFSKSIQPCCLPWTMKGETFANKTVTASGWGTTSSGGSASSVLLKVDLPVLSSVQCQQFYGSAVNDNNICTYEVGKDTCQGDSGGSIDMKSVINGQHYAIGVVSWGVGCAGVKQPGVYTKVTNYLSWITSKTGETFCQS